MSKHNMIPDGTGHRGSNFTREEYREWQGWMDNPKGTLMHQDVGSRARPVSFGASSTRSSVDELWDRMVARGVVAAEPAKPKKKAKRTVKRG